MQSSPITLVRQEDQDTISSALTFAGHDQHGISISKEVEDVYTEKAVTAINESIFVEFQNVNSGVTTNTQAHSIVAP